MVANLRLRIADLRFRIANHRLRHTRVERSPKELGRAIHTYLEGLFKMNFMGMKYIQSFVDNAS